MTPALTLHNSFSRLGSPRERIWYELRMVDLQVLRQFKKVWASGSCSVTFWFERLKNPGSALLYRLANSEVVIHPRYFLASSWCRVLSFIPMAMSVCSLM